jgi:hypothetical protein
MAWEDTRQTTYIVKNKCAKVFKRGRMLALFGHVISLVDFLRHLTEARRAIIKGKKLPQ